jgi:nitroreductase
MKTLLKRLLPRAIIDYLKTLLYNLRIPLLIFFSSNRLLSGLFYLFFSREFGREQMKVLQGRVAYYKNHLQFDQKSSPMLRRNIHRLEKGIIMRPRKQSFAADYIVETVNAYLSMSSSNDACSRELDWARDVLTQYFDIVKDTPPIKKAREAFTGSAATEPVSLVPYKDSERVRSAITLEQLEALFWQRRSTRWFSDKEVDQTHIDKAIELASLAPSACNRQPYYFYVSKNKEQATKLAKLAVGTGGFADNFPCVIAIVGDLSAYPHEKDRHLIYIDGALASMQLMLAIEAMGLSSCPLNWPDIEWRERAVDELLDLPAEQRVIMLLGVGHADTEGMIPYSKKKATDTLKVPF